MLIAVLLLVLKPCCNGSCSSRLLRLRVLPLLLLVLVLLVLGVL
jgi:hypothetical protein